MNEISCFIQNNPDSCFYVLIDIKIRMESPNKYFRLGQFSTTRRKNIILSICLCSWLLFITIAIIGIREQYSSIHSNQIDNIYFAYHTFSRCHGCIRVDDVCKCSVFRSNSTAEPPYACTLSDIFILFSHCLVDYTSCTSEINQWTKNARFVRQKLECWSHRKRFLINYAVDLFFPLTYDLIILRS